MSRTRSYSGVPLVGGPVTSTTNFLGGIIAKWDVSGPLSKRVLYNNAPREFAYLATDPLPFKLYIKQGQRGLDSDWSPGQPIALDLPGVVQDLLDLRDLLIGDVISLDDNNYQAAPSDRQVNILSLTAPRTVYLPDVTKFSEAFEFVVADVNGVAADNKTVTVRPFQNSTQRVVNADQNIIELYEPYMKIRVRKVANDAWMLM